MSPEMNHGLHGLLQNVCLRANSYDTAGMYEGEAGRTMLQIATVIIISYYIIIISDT
jgi:hypothetical protein